MSQKQRCQGETNAVGVPGATEMEVPRLTELEVPWPTEVELPWPIEVEVPLATEVGAGGHNMRQKWRSHMLQKWRYYLRPKVTVPCRTQSGDATRKWGSGETNTLFTGCAPVQKITNRAPSKCLHDVLAIFQGKNFQMKQVFKINRWCRVLSP